MNFSQENLQELISSILKHRRLYAMGEPEISDEEYDALEHKLSDLTADHPLLQEVGYGDDGKIKHPIPVLSLEKTRTFERIRYWAHKASSKNSSELEPSKIELTCLYKLDGAFISLVYQGGHFVLAKTRGGGSSGEEVTHKLKHLPHLPLTIPLPHSLESSSTLEIRGELCCSHQDFSKLKEIMKQKELPPPSSKRNIVAGVLSRKDHHELSGFFSFWAFDVVHSHLGEDHLFEKETQKLAYLSKCGFSLAPSGTHSPPKILNFTVLPDVELIYQEGECHSLIVGTSRNHLKVPASYFSPQNFPSKLSEASHTKLKITGEFSITNPKAWKDLLSELAIPTTHLFSSQTLKKLLGQIFERKLTQKQQEKLANIWQFAAYNLQGPGPESSLPTQEVSKCQWLKEQGFFLSPSYQDFCEYLQKAQDYRKSPERPLDIDGLVLSYNLTSTHPKAGYTAHHPNFRLSYKWQDTEAKSTISEIHWEVSRNGTITPVLIIEPVNIGGSKIQRVTLYNKRSFEQWNPTPGDTVWVVRSGAVIPKITRLIKNPETSKSPPQIPSFCPACSTPLDLTSEVTLTCPNSQGCPPQLAGSIDHWCQSVGIDDLSKKRISLLIEHHFLKNIADLYRLQEKKEKLYVVAGLGPKMVDKILKNIEKSKDLSLLELLMGLGITGLQKTTAQDILTHYPTLDKVLKLTEKELSSLEGFAEKSANTIILGISDKKDLIQELKDLGAQIKDHP